MKNIVNNIKTQFIFIMMFALMLSACDNIQNEFDNTQINNKVQLTQSEINILHSMRNGCSNRISLDEATKIANEVIGFLDNETTTKSGNSRQISSITTLKSERENMVMTKSVSYGGNENAEDLDTLAYLINFADSAGYTIIAAYTRVENPILCYTGSGTLGDTSDNSGIAIFLQGAESYIKRSIVETQAARDSLLNDILAKIKDTGVSDTTYVVDDGTITKAIPSGPVNTIPDEISVSHSFGPWTVYENVEPLLSVEWGQFAPFNAVIPKSCSDNSGGKAPVGCVAVATSYILTYWLNKKSTILTLDGYVFDSNLLCKYTCNPERYAGAGIYNINASSNEANTARSQIARLLERIGSRIGMDYGCDGSGADISDGVKFLNNLWFTGETSGKNYNFNDVKNSLLQERPVMIEGFAEKDTFLGISFLYTLKQGHAWVIDGYLKRKQIDNATVTVTSYQTQSNGMIMIINTTTNEIYTTYSPYYLHNNWGNYYNNGYYVEGAFDFCNGPDLTSNTKSYEEGNFQYNNKIYPNIYF